MKYENICKGKFIERPNRFVAEVETGGETVRAHVKNTGRCRELLVPGAEVYLEDFSGRMGSRKLRYSLIGVRKGELLINMDSQAPNRVCEEALLSGRLVLPGMEKLAVIKREKNFGTSRFDFYLESENGRKGWLEVKGVTLEEEGIAKFPDAPTERGVKHVCELMRAAEEGYLAYVLFVVQMRGISCFAPNERTHRAFAEVLRTAQKKGVRVLACDCDVTGNTLEIHTVIPVRLD